MEASSVGGLVGYNNGGTISASYATGAVTSTSGENVGGLAGENEGTISASYATGDAAGNRFVGGLVGYNEWWHDKCLLCDRSYNRKLQVEVGVLADSWGIIMRAR